MEYVKRAAKYDTFFLRWKGEIDGKSICLWRI